MKTQRTPLLPSFGSRGSSVASLCKIIKVGRRVIDRSSGTPRRRASLIWYNVAYILTGDTWSAPVGLVANRYEDMEMAAKRASRHVVMNVERLFRRCRDEYMVSSIY
jgi:hypothetical protein